MSPDPDLVAARMTGVGLGFMALMVSWLIGNRLTALVWGPPVGPIVALLGAIAIGTVTAIVAGRRLAATVHIESPDS